MLEKTELVLRQDCTVLITKTRMTNKFKGLCIKGERSIYNFPRELPQEELIQLSLLPDINEILENGGAMVATMSGYFFSTTIGYVKDKSQPTSIDNLKILETVSSPNYCHCLMELDVKLGEKRFSQSINHQALQYKKE